MFPKLWPFIYQTNDRTRCYDVTIDVTIINELSTTTLIIVHVRARESEGTACVVVLSGTQFESLFYFFLHVRPHTFGHARAKERPVWLLLLARGLNVFGFFYLFFVRTATHVRTCTSVHQTDKRSFVALSGTAASSIYNIIV